MVASEVKQLATQTAKATDEISGHISGMQTATQVSVAAIKEIGLTIKRIAEISTAISAAVEQQGAATQEITRNVHSAAQSTSEVAGNISNVARGTGDTGTASNQVLASAGVAVDRKRAAQGGGGEIPHHASAPPSELRRGASRRRNG